MVEAVVKNCELLDTVLDTLYKHLEQYLEQDEHKNPPLILRDKIVAVTGKEKIIWMEPLVY